jgi:hypothetical protein
MPRGTSRALLIAAGLLALASCARGPNLSSAVRVEAAPRIDPDYAGIVIPPNIAPLNFRVLEDGSDCVVRISSDGAATVELRCPERQCRMSVKAWRELLSQNKGKSLYYDIYLRKADGAWTQYATFANRVAEEPIDPYIVYRRLTPNNQFTVIKGIFQRDLENFETAPMLTLSQESGCYNCHTFCQGNPDKFFFHLRGENGGMVFVRDGRIYKINTRQGPISRPTAFASWHPDGARIVASVNDEYHTFFPSTAKLGHFEASHVRGDLVVYNLETNTLSTSREVFENGYIQTHPCWSADGKWIFYVRCRRQQPVVQKDFEKLRFDLMRISYDAASDAWGTPETLLECSKLGKSCTFPRASPDGRYLLCVLCDRATFAVYQNSADLCLFDLESKTWRRLDALNGDFVDSFPVWSSNGRWFSFTSRRRDDISALPYFGYFDAQGREHKPFLLPQEDPGGYDTFTDSYNAVQLVKGKVTIDPLTLAEAARQPAIPALFPNPPNVEAYTGTTPPRH